MSADAFPETVPGGSLAGATLAASGTAVRDSAGRTVVSCGDDTPVPCDNGGYTPAQAIAAGGHDFSDIHEIDIPVGPRFC